MDERMKNRRLSSGLQRAKATLERFRLPLLILTLGGILLLLPSGGTGKAAQDAQSPAQQTQPADDMRQALSQLLSSMEGVGRVELLLTTTGSDETFYQTDVRRSGETSEETTVFSANQSAQKTPVVTKTKKASYAGASWSATEQTAQWSGCALCRQFPPSRGLGAIKSVSSK